MSRRGVTLLETLIALVILGLVVTAALELYASSLRATAQAQAWSPVAGYVEEGMEMVTLDLSAAGRSVPEALPGGYERSVAVRPAGAGLMEVTVTVAFPDGGEFSAHRLVASP